MACVCLTQLTSVASKKYGEAWGWVRLLAWRIPQVLEGVGESKSGRVFESTKAEVWER